MKKRTVLDCLTLIHNNQINANAIRDINKPDLENFILEILSKGYLNKLIKHQQK